MRAARCAVWGVAWGVAIAGTAPAALRAQPAQPASADADAEYAPLVSGALAEFEQGRWEQARAFFERAHALRPSARTLWGLGTTAFELGRYAQAIAELEAALRDPRMPLDGSQRAQARDVIARAARHVGVLSVELEPEHAELALDGERTEDRELALSPGTYTLSARAQGFVERELRVALEAGEQRALRLALTPIPLRVEPPPQQRAALTAQTPANARDETDDGGSVLGSWWLWTAVGVVAAAAVTTLIVLEQDEGSAPGPKVHVRKTVLSREP